MTITQTPPAPIAYAPMAIQTALVTMVFATPTRETRASRKCPRGTGQSSTTPDSDNSPLDLGDSQVDAVGASSYVHTFMVDGVPLPTMDSVRP